MKAFNGQSQLVLLGWPFCKYKLAPHAHKMLTRGINQATLGVNLSGKLEVTCDWPTILPPLWWLRSVHLQRGHQGEETRYFFSMGKSYLHCFFSYTLDAQVRVVCCLLPQSIHELLDVVPAK